MKYTDFDYITHFTSNEVIATGAHIEDVAYLTIKYLDRVRSLVDKPIKLIHNGLTSGNHTSRTHLEGCAVDFYVMDDISHTEAVKVALYGVSVGFRGIGVYWNGEAYSFHFDTRNELGTWYGTKTNKNDSWCYHGLMFNRSK